MERVGQAMFQFGGNAAEVRLYAGVHAPLWVLWVGHERRSLCCPVVCVCASPSACIPESSPSRISRLAYAYAFAFAHAYRCSPPWTVTITGCLILRSSPPPCPSFICIRPCRWMTCGSCFKPLMYSSTYYRDWNVYRVGVDGMAVANQLIMIMAVWLFLSDPLTRPSMCHTLHHHVLTPLLPPPLSCCCSCVFPSQYRYRELPGVSTHLPHGLEGNAASSRHRHCHPTCRSHRHRKPEARHRPGVRIMAAASSGECDFNLVRIPCGAAVRL